MSFIEGLKAIPAVRVRPAARVSAPFPARSRPFPLTFRGKTARQSKESLADRALPFRPCPDPTQDLAAVPTREGKMRRAGQLAKIVLDEFAGVLKMVPYGIRAMRAHRSLPDARAPAGRDGVSIARDVRYADAPRAVMDIYLPRGVSIDDAARAVSETVSESTTAAQQGSPVSSSAPDDDKLPVALFVHGGVWAVGEKWQFAPMASRLAEEGVVTCVATYTLFPKARADTMWREVSDAITWTLDNVDRYGGDADRVTLLGHSAGAHVCSMALLHRCGVTSDVTGVTVDRRQPKCYVGLCGVYDIARHYDYEDSRGVALVSTMGRCMGGKGRFEQCSPLRVLRANAEVVRSNPAFQVCADADAEERRKERERAEAAAAELAAAEMAASIAATKKKEHHINWAPMSMLDTDGDGDMCVPVADIVEEAAAVAEARLVDLEKKPESGADDDAGATRGFRDARDSAATSRAVTPVPGPPPGALAGDDAARMSGYWRLSGNAPSARGPDGPDGASAPDAPAASQLSGVNAPGCFPPTYLLAGCADHTVPWFESAEFHLALRDASVPSRLCLYLKESHGEFVVGWRPRPKPASRGEQDGAEAAGKTSAWGDDTPVNAWGDGLDGDLEARGLSAHNRDVIRIIKC